MKPEWICLLEDIGTWLAPLKRLGRRTLTLPATHADLLAQSEALVDALHPRSMRLRLIETVEETPTTQTLRFDRLDGALPPFRPGQYVSLTVEIGEVKTTRPYSISSRPGAQHLDLTVKREPSGFVSPYLLEQAPGWEVTTSGPAGSFVHEPLRDRGPVVLLSGGSGITPFMSMLRHFAAEGFPAPVHLIHGSREVDDVIFESEFTRLSARHDSFDALSVISRPPPGYTGPSGHLDADLISQQVGDIAGASFFVCGPNGFIEHVVGQLRSLGAADHAIRRESFGPPKDVTKMPGWPDHVTASDTFKVELVGHDPLPVRAGEPLLVALEREGQSVPALCRTGECADCRIKLLSGEVWSLPSAGVREADRARGFVHACVAYAVSDLSVDIGS